MSSQLKAIKWDGNAISKSGLYSDVPIEAYHSQKICTGASISSSGLRTIFSKSPAHFYSQWKGNPNRVETDDNKAFIVGRAAHHLFLGEKNFYSLFALQPAEYVSAEGVVKPWNGNANVCRAWAVARFKEGRTILTAKDMDSIKGMAVALGSHPIIRAGALNGQVERSMFWKDKETGIWLKSRPDNIPEGDEDFIDLKTTVSVVWTDLVKTIGEYGYQQQGGLIRRGAREVLGMKSPTFALVFIEKKPPHCPRVVTLKDSDLDRGEKQNSAAIRIFAECLEKNHWPGPGGDSEDAEYIEISEYAQKRIDDALTIMGSG